MTTYQMSRTETKQWRGKAPFNPDDNRTGLPADNARELIIELAKWRGCNQITDWHGNSCWTN